MNKAPEGMYIPGPGKYDMTGDGVNDIAVVMTKAESEARKDEFAAEKLTVYTLEGHTFSLTENDKGYIHITSQVGASISSNLSIITLRLMFRIWK